jgi:CubicO group peptidase (beta-lactamase class C family)
MGALSPSGLAKLKAAMASHVERGAVPGVVTLVACESEVHVEACGVMDLRNGAPMRRDTIFRISSMTKPLTAVAALMLLEEGKLGLDEPVDRLLPELADRKVLARLDGPIEETVPARRAITLRDLLTFRAGVGAVMAPPGRYPIQKAMAEAGLAVGANPPALASNEWLALLGALPSMRQPGEHWMYHTASGILGVLIARAAGMSLGDFLAGRIFEPLGMRDTGFHVPVAKLGRFATCYRADALGGLAVQDEARGLWARPALFEAGSNGLVSTVDDYLAFARALLGGGSLGETRLLSPSTVAEMTSDQITAEQKAISPFFPGFWESRGWGFGLSVMTKDEPGGPPHGSFGWDGGFCTCAYCDPESGMIAILMAPARPHRRSTPISGHMLARRGLGRSVSVALGQGIHTFALGVFLSPLGGRGGKRTRFACPSVLKRSTRSVELWRVALEGR